MGVLSSWAPAQDAVLSGLRSLSSVKSAGAAWQWYVLAEPLAGAVAVALLAAAVTYLLSLPTNKHSWVDKMWSLIPIFYAWHFALHDQLIASPASPVSVSARQAAIAVLITIWGVRLTYNFARKGGYRWHDEDYRWPIVRAYLHPVLFQVFSITFISIIQSLLLLAIVAPGYVAWQNRDVPFGPLDLAASVLCVFFLAFEAVADQQQWVFQTAKHAKMAAGKRLTGEYAKGFLTSGLWEYSRHPNFFAEMSFWWSMYLFSVAATGEWLHWSMAGAFSLSLLFQGSTQLTEAITASKYKKYKEYQATTSRIIPWFPSAPAGAKKRSSTRRATRSTQEDEQPEEYPSPVAAPAAAAPAEEPTPVAAKTPATIRRARAARTPKAAAAETPAVRTSSRLRAKSSAQA